MDRDDLFDVRPGRIGRDASEVSSGRAFRNGVIRAANLAGGGRAVVKAPAGRSRFTGERIGRGSGAGRVLASRKGLTGFSHRRVMVKARIVKLAGKGRGAAAAHLRYVQRDGVTRDGRAGELYDARGDVADSKAFLDRADGDRHQFRFIVSPEDGAQYEDLKSVTRRLMAKMEADLGTELDWVAVDHFNTGHPHTHILVRGKDDLGKDLIIAKSYITDGIRERASEIVSLDLGPRTQQEIDLSLKSEMAHDRFTSLDRWIIERREEDGRVRAIDADPQRQSLISGRLNHLEDLGLASPDKEGHWQVRDDLEPALRALGRRGDIINSLSYDLRSEGQEHLIHGAVVHDAGSEARGMTASETPAPVIGLLIRRGLYDEFEDRHYLVIDGVDGHVHVMDIGPGEHTAPLSEQSLLKVEANRPEVKEADRTIAEVASRHGGWYSAGLHRQHDPEATDRFITAHVRRVEAVRRGTGDVIERLDGGTFGVGADYETHALDYERQRAAQSPASVEILSAEPVNGLIRRQGYTWLDQELLSGTQTPLADRGFGHEVQDALRQRYRWLEQEGLVKDLGDGTFEHPKNIQSLLTGRELTSHQERLAREIGKPFGQVYEYERFEGVLKGKADLTSGAFAVVERSRDFVLLPWRDVLEHRIGQGIGGVMRGRDIDWSFGRDRGLDIGM